MKSFKVLMFLTLAAALSCGANGSPTNVTTDGYPTKPSKEALTGIMNSLQGIADLYFNQSKGDYAWFTKEYVDRLAYARLYNYVICHVKHTYQFDGTKGIDWDQGYVHDNSGEEAHPVQQGPSFDVLVGRSGTFTRQGKGGYWNWAWNGFTVWNQDMKSNVVHFVQPPTGRLQEGSGD